jgi:DNA-binding response OmpR family regulator
MSAAMATRDLLRAGDLTLDTSTGLLIGPTAELQVNRGEFILLRCLMARPGRIYEFASIIEALWPDPDIEPERPEHAVRTRVMKARCCIKYVGGDPELLRSIWGIGYLIGVRH